MAPQPGPPLGLSTPHRSILSIQKSESPFTEQLKEAVAILGIDSRTDFGFPETFAVDERDFDPRYEFVLRWLLKNFASGVGHETFDSLTSRHYAFLTFATRPSSQAHAWFLVRIALTKTPLTKSARLLIENKFMRIVQQTLEWLQNTVRGNRSLIDSKHNGQDSTALVSNFENGQSVPTSLEDSPKQALSITWPEWASKEFSWVFELFAGIFLNIRQIQSYINYQQHADEEVAAERMLQTLKASVDETASILGSMLYLLHEAIEHDKSNEPTSSTKWAAIGMVERCLDSFIELWENRSLRVESQSKQHCYVSPRG